MISFCLINAYKILKTEGKLRTTPPPQHTHLSPTPGGIPYFKLRKSPQGDKMKYKPGQTIKSLLKNLKNKGIPIS